MSQTLAQMRAWSIWVYYAERVKTIIEVCQKEETKVLNERNHYKGFIREQNKRLHQVIALVNKLDCLNYKYKIEKFDCIEQWTDEIQTMYYFVNQNY